jgi:hypothetical protein
MTPTPEEWDAGAVTERPRVLATATDFQRAERLVGTDERATAWFDAVEARADALLDEPPEEHGISGRNMLGTSRTVLGRTLDLGTCYRLTGEERYADRLWTELDAVAGFPDWNPAHFLDVAEMTAAVGVGYDWFYDRWSDDQRAHLADAIVENGLEEALPGYRSEPGERPGTVWWMDVDHNWNTVCNGGLTVGALALLGSDHDPTAVEVVEGTRGNVAQAIEAIGPGGGWAEGTTYWGYNAKYLSIYLASITNALGTDFGYLDRPGVAAVGEFPIHMTSPAGGNFAFGDAHGEGRLRESGFHWFARTFDRPTHAGYQARSLEVAAPADHKRDHALNVLWYDPEVCADPEQAGLDRDREFPGGDSSVVMRSAWDDPDAAFLGFKAGDNRTNHGDLDVGTFVFDAAGVRWATDLGSNDYSLPGYWDMSEGRWRYYRKRAEGHNTLVIDPDGKPDQDPTASCGIDRLESGEESAFAVADLSPAYPGASVERGVGLVDGRSELVVQDEISADAAEVWWFFHTGAAIDADGRTATLERGGERTTAAVVSPAAATFETMSATPLPPSPAPGEEAPVEGVSKLAIRLPDVEETTLTVRVGPDATPDREVTPIDEWSVE